eukprot:s3767_g1.t1
MFPGASGGAVGERLNGLPRLAIAGSMSQGQDSETTRHWQSPGFFLNSGICGFFSAPAEGGVGQ